MEFLTEIAPNILLGIGLAAAVGFRIFIPLLISSLAAYFFNVDLNDSFAWIGTLPAVIIFGSATLLEILAYFIPWFDNLLDVIATPAAFLAGTVVMAASMIEIDPLWMWAIAIIAGGGTATLIKGSNATVRGASSLSTGGVGNPFIGAMESLMSVVLTVFSFIVPVIIGIVVIIFLLIFGRKLWKWFFKKKAEPQSA